jgi:hypothetical protein
MLRERKNGTWAHHDILPGQALVTFWNDLWRVYTDTPKKLDATEVFVSRVEEDALDFCAANKLTVIR